MEYWDAYDGELRRIRGVSLIRGEDIPEGGVQFQRERQ